LITLKFFGANFRIRGAIAPIDPPGYAPVQWKSHLQKTKNTIESQNLFAVSIHIM